MSFSRKKSCSITEENNSAYSKLPKSSKSNRKPLSVQSSNTKPLISSNTPNFGNLVPQVSAEISQIPKLSLDYIFDDSLEFSDIIEKEKIDTCRLGPCKGVIEKIESPAVSVKKSYEAENIFQRNFQKYEQALVILQKNFFGYREDTEKKIQNIQEEVALIKNSIKHDENIKNCFSSLIDTEINKTKSALKSELKNFLNNFYDKNHERPPTQRATLERIKKIREQYDSKILENEKYLVSLKQTSQEPRSKSSSRGCSELFEENRSLREELSNLWNKH
jgi:hypothetical protein